MLEIYFIRHGESAGNREERFRGRHDFPLNENGIRQARALRNELGTVKFDLIYSSPLSRALKTARILANEKTPVKEESGFNNISLGDWENSLKSEVRTAYPDLWKLWTTTPEKLSFPGMEPLSAVKERSHQTLKRLLREHSSGRIAIVSHRAVLKPLFASMLKIPEPYFWKIHIDTAAYCIAEYRNERGFTFTLLNQTRHLAEFVREELG